MRFVCVQGHRGRGLRFCFFCLRPRSWDSHTSPARRELLELLGYDQTHVLNWVTLRGNLLRKCRGCGACYRAVLFTLSSRCSGSLFVGLFCKAQPSVQLWEKCGIKVPQSSLALTLISFACHSPFVWMALRIRLDLWGRCVCLCVLGGTRCV